MERSVMLRIKVSRKLYADVVEKTKQLGYTSKSEFIRDCVRKVVGGE